MELFKLADQKSKKKKKNKEKEQELDDDIPSVLSLSQIHRPQVQHYKQKEETAQVREPKEKDSTSIGICGLCEKPMVVNSTPLVSYPCKHSYHLSCLEFYQSNRTIRQNCHVCKNKSLHDPENDYIHTLLHSPMTLFTGVIGEEKKEEEYKRVIIGLVEEHGYDHKGDVISFLRNKKGKTKNGSNDKDNNSHEGTGMMSMFFKVITGDKYAITKDSLDIYKPETMVCMNVEISIMMNMGITMNALRKRGVNIYYMLQNNYGLFDWICLGATWTDLKKMKLKACQFRQFPNLVNVPDLIRVYTTLDNIDFSHFFEDVCDSNIHLLATVGLSVEQFRLLKFSHKFVDEYAMDPKVDGKHKELWCTLTRNEWNSLGVLLAE